ncbi:hypothetical protein LWI28_009850 [Acer negundo]|uniref:Leucine-rich repeat-containing N-terminal plant-type domain-containing protein n=1 Tax=Acer negundo TaxID=4023 RepID=A0AAD5NRS6_ACENE|nr:hypothetical protein LWI28_009850 [Acer negundo]
MGSSWSFFTFMYLRFLLFFFQLTSSSSRQPLCHEVEHHALIQFKESLFIGKLNTRLGVSNDPSAYSKTALWDLEENSDCCSWDGVECNEDTGYVIKLDLSSSYLYGSINSTSTLFHLVHLQWLSLANNDFSDSNIPSGIMNLSRLLHLNLSNSHFSGQIPTEMLELSNLESIDLSHNSLQGIIPSSLGNLTNLIYLDLSLNKFGGGLPTSIGNLAKLKAMHIYGCGLSGQVPSSLSNLTQLNYLDLAFNQFSSQSSSLSWIGKQTKLTGLDLSGINLGEIPFWLVNLTHLTYLILNQNQLTGPFPSQICNLTQLKYLDLASNQLQGPIPNSIFELNNLENLYLSSNNLSGTMELEMFLSKFKISLSALDLSSNRLSLLTNPTVNTSSHKFHLLSLVSCNLHSFPNFLRNQDQLHELDLSSNYISGEIPGWFFNLSLPSLRCLNLSHNLFTGYDQHFAVLPWTSLIYLDLSFNQLQGSLPIPSTSIAQVYVVSNNKLSGKIQSWICKLNFLYALDLSNNNLSGKLPQCLGNSSRSLLMLNLQNNKFHGSIPQTFMNGTKLRMIDLSNNMLRGKIPRSLANCTMLEFLDLGNNKISDTFPSWIGTLPKLVVLNLHSNRFHGMIEDPKSDFEFPKLQIIDLSHNRFTGKLPSKYIECWNAMKIVNESQLAYMMKAASDADFYDYSVTLVNKGIDREYVKISNMLVSVYLSNNRFEGEIPASISILKGLRYLDLSNNNLVGGISSSLCNLTVLESLDLSNNNLSGEIPPQLVKLTPLAFFNVS